MTGIDFLGLVVGVALGYALGHVLVFFFQQGELMIGIDSTYIILLWFALIFLIATSDDWWS